MILEYSYKFNYFELFFYFPIIIKSFYFLSHQLYPENLEIENGFSAQIQSALSRIGHKIKCFNYGGSIVQGESDIF